MDDYENSYLLSILSQIKSTNKENVVNLIFLDTSKESIKDMEDRLANVVNDNITNECDKVVFIHSSAKYSLRRLDVLIAVEEYNTLCFSRRVLNRVTNIINKLKLNPRISLEYVFHIEP